MSSAALRFMRISSGRSCSIAAVRIVYRASDVSAAASGPFPQTSPGRTRPPVAEREEIVEVAADLLGRRRLVVHGDLDAGDVREPRWRQAALQRARERLGATLMAQRPVAQLVLVAQLRDQRLAIGERVRALLRRLRAIVGRGLALGGGLQPQPGDELATPGGAMALAGGAHDRVTPAVRGRTFAPLGRGIGLRGGDIARVGGVVARQRSEIAHARRLIARRRAVETRLARCPARPCLLSLTGPLGGARRTRRS